MTICRELSWVAGTTPETIYRKHYQVCLYPFSNQLCRNRNTIKLIKSLGNSWSLFFFVVSVAEFDDYVNQNFPIWVFGMPWWYAGGGSIWQSGHLLQLSTNFGKNQATKKKQRQIFRGWLIWLEQGGQWSVKLLKWGNCQQLPTITSCQLGGAGQTYLISWRKIIFNFYSFFSSHNSHSS